MAHHSLWRRLTGRGSKRRSFFDTQHAARTAVNLDIPLGKIQANDGVLASSEERGPASQPKVPTPNGQQKP